MNGYWNGFRDGSWSNAGWGGGGWNNWGWGGGFGPAFGWGLGSGLGWGLGSGLIGWNNWGWGGGWNSWGWGGGWNSWGWGGGFGPGFGWGLGSGLGWGVSSWLFGSPIYNWGYANYVNPYGMMLASPMVITAPLGIENVVGGTVVYDYTQPIDTQTPPAAPDAADAAVALFDQGRDAFKAGQYDQALALADQALTQLPNDATIHEFRALTLFAQGKYTEAAATLYAVLSVGPGWDWPTLIGLYPNVSVYTAQVRELEAYRDRNKNDPAPHFVAAYHYLTQGHKDAAAKELKVVTRLEPKDSLSAELLRMLQGGEAAPITVDAAPPEARDAAANEPALAAPAEEAEALRFPLAGSGRWVAKPDEQTTITLEMKPGDTFVWTVARGGNPASTIEGDASDGKGVLTLTSKKSGALVGQVRWTDEREFTFRLLGSPEGDPGLTFQREM